MAPALRGGVGAQGGLVFTCFFSDLLKEPLKENVPKGDAPLGIINITRPANTHCMFVRFFQDGVSIHIVPQMTPKRC